MFLALKIVLAVVALAIFATVLFWLLPIRGKREEEQDAPIVAIVALLQEPQHLESIYIVKAAERAWGADLGSGVGGDHDEGEDGFVVSTESNGVKTSLVNFRDRAIVVNAFDEPYFDPSPEILEQLTDLRMRELVARHQAWLSVDAIGIEPHEGAEELNQWHRLLGRLITELIDDNCLALLFTIDGQIFPNLDETLEKLKSDDPLQALKLDLPAPVVSISEDDPRMAAAVQEARDRFPEFVAAMEQQRGENFSVKAPISNNGNTEFIWLEATAIENGIIYGVLANEPMDLGKLKIGDRVKTTVADLNDWAYYADDQLVGGFTVKVLMDAQKKRKDQGS